MSKFMSLFKPSSTSSMRMENSRGGIAHTVGERTDLLLKGSSQNDQIIRIKGINSTLLDCMFFL